MPTNVDKSPRRGLGNSAARFFETLGLLNKGSANRPATLSSEEAAKTDGISNNALNATRVAGLTSIIAAAGATAITIFKVDKTTDNPAVVVAAFVSVGAIVASALFTVGIMVSADVRSRASAVAKSTNPSQQASGTSELFFDSTWRGVLEDLQYGLDRLRYHTDDAFGVWLDAFTGSSSTARLNPRGTDYEQRHARLCIGQSQVLSELAKIMNTSKLRKRERALERAEAVVSEMKRSL